MSEKKTNKGKLFHKLHQLQKTVTRLLRIGKTDKMIEVKEKHLIDKIKGKEVNMTNEGFLIKNNEKWFVKWNDLHSNTQWTKTPLQESDQSNFFDYDEGKKVKFETDMEDFKVVAIIID